MTGHGVLAGLRDADRLDCHFVDGSWRAADRPGEIEVFDSTDASVLATIPAGTAEEAAAAVEAAAGAFAGWAATSVAARCDAVDRIAAALTEHRDELAALISRETGMPLALSYELQVDSAIDGFRQAATHARAFQFEHQVGHTLVVSEPVGVVSCITPWNYPLLQIAGKVAFAMVAGCTVVLKPSEIAPLDAFVLAECVTAAGVPAGVFNMVNGFGPDVGEVLASHPAVDMVSFTGSNRAGRRVAELAAATVKRVALELGGKSPNILLDDVDDDELHRALRAGVDRAFVNTGQTCDALTRLLVPRERLAAVEAVLQDIVGGLTVGDPFAPETDLGPLASRVQQGRVAEYVAVGRDEGARVLDTGQRELPDEGFYAAPIVFTDVTPSMRVAREEIFGPVLAVMPYDSLDEAVDIANDVVYGLGGGVWSADESRAIQVARRIRTGQVEINGGVVNGWAPFGGFKQSGVGREFGVAGFQEFLEHKSLHRPTAHATGDRPSDH